MYKLNREKIIIEEFDGDLVLVHLESGNYYNLTGTGGDIFRMLNNNYSIKDIEDAYGDSFDIVSFKEFISELKKEEIIVGSSENGEKVEVIAASYTHPELEKYEDMQDIIKLDPIHDVDGNAGWPKTKENS